LIGPAVIVRAEHRLRLKGSNMAWVDVLSVRLRTKVSMDRVASRRLAMAFKLIEPAQDCWGP
jgi:hypothetical protein